MPTRAALRTDPTPSTIVQKMTGWIIILISATKASPSGLSPTANAGNRKPTMMPRMTAPITARYR